MIKDDTPNLTKFAYTLHEFLKPGYAITTIQHGLTIVRNNNT